MNRLLTLTLLALLLLACKKDKASDPTPAQPQLPPATQTGANTFGCYVNGKLFRQKDQIRWPHTYTDAVLVDFQTFTDTTYWLMVGCRGQWAVLDTPQYTATTIDIFIPYPPQVGKRYRAITNPWTDWGGGKIMLHKTSNSAYYKDLYSQANIDSGWVYVTRFDLDNMIVSGMFEFTATDISQPDNIGTLHVTEGRFDCHYTY